MKVESIGLGCFGSGNEHTLGRQDIIIVCYAAPLLSLALCVIFASIQYKRALASIIMIALFLHSIFCLFYLIFAAFFLHTQHLLNRLPNS